MRRNARLLFGVSFAMTLLLIIGLSAHAKTSPWTSVNRIAISADGNPDADTDDISATPLTLAVLAKAGLQDNLVHYDFNNWLEYKPVEPQDNQLWHSAMGGQSRWGFDRSRFFDGTYDPLGAIHNLRNEINQSTADDPLYLIAAGPLELVYQAFETSDPNARDHVYIITHHQYNNYFKPRLWHRNLDDLYALHPNLHVIQIKDQNGGLKAKNHNVAEWHWLRDHQDPNLQWIFDRIQTGKPDCSDTGILTWLIGLNGEDEELPILELKEWFGDEKVPTNGGSADAPAAPDAQTPVVNFPKTPQVFQEIDGKLVIEAESVPLTDDWRFETAEDGYTGKGYIRCVTPDLDTILHQHRSVLIYKIRIQNPGKYRMALKHSNQAAPAFDQWNSCWTLMGIDIHPFGIVRRTFIDIEEDAFENQPAGFTFQTKHKNYGTITKREGPYSEPVYDLTRGDHYFFIAGRSGGYRLDKIHFFKEGVSGFGDDSIAPTPVLASR